MHDNTDIADRVRQKNTFYIKCYEMRSLFEYTDLYASFKGSKAKAVI